MFGRSKRLQYLIKWKGYPESDNSWEPADQVHAPDLIKHYQSAIKVISYRSAGEEQSAIEMRELKGMQSTLKNYIECPTIFPASLLNASLKTFLSKSSLPSNTPSTTLTPLSPVPLASSTSATNLTQNTLLTITGTASSATVPSTTPIEACPTSRSMPQSNPPPTVLPLPGSLVVLATSPFQSRNYSASPSPSPSTRTTPLLVYPDNSAQVTPPTRGLQMCQS